MPMQEEPIVIECIYNVPTSRVWKAIADISEMKKWYFEIPMFKPEVGNKFEFSGGPSPDRQYLYECVVMEVIPGKKLSYSWRYPGYPGNTVVVFEISVDEMSASLRLTHSGITSFPGNNADFNRNNFVTGWNYIINTSLKNYLEN
jgi:uncharacterized protein YndB with AHSA1/START domain